MPYYVDNWHGWKLIADPLKHEHGSHIFDKTPAGQQAAVVLINPSVSNTTCHDGCGWLDVCRIIIIWTQVLNSGKFSARWYLLSVKRLVEQAIVISKIQYVCEPCRSTSARPT
jgi:hypothetical protein